MAVVLDVTVGADWVVQVVVATVATVCNMAVQLQQAVTQVCPTLAVAVAAVAVIHSPPLAATVVLEL